MVRSYRLVPPRRVNLPWTCPYRASTQGNSISLPFPMGKDEDVCSINAAGANNKYMVNTYSLPEQIASPQGGSGVYTCSGNSDGACAQCDGGVCFPKHRGDEFSGLRQAGAEGTNHMLLPDHPGQARHLHGRISNPRTISLREVLFQILQRHGRQQQYGFDNLCRRSDWHCRGSDRPAHWQGSPAAQRMWVRVGRVSNF